MQEFFVDNFRVDLPRNQIVCEGEIIALEPKVLEVLRVLAETPGEVVTHQELLERVWPDMVVAPNALQRCIGQLRKALNDDGKKQSVIVTHPKKGYSLIAKVSFKTSADTAVSEEGTKTKSEDSNPQLLTGWAIIIAAVVIAITLLFTQFNNEPETSFKSLNQLTPLTATDNSEFYSTFSPDGRYVAFSRQGGHMWLKDLTNNQEIQITRQAGHYGQPNWSTDGKQLTFLSIGSCEDGCLNNRCSSISNIYIPLALSEPQDTTTLIHCETIPLQGIQWISDKELAYIKFEPDESSIILLNTQTGNLRTLYHIEETRPYSMSFTNITNQLAVMQQTPQLQQELVLLTADGKSLKRTTFNGPQRYGSWTRWYPVWNPTGDKLLFSAKHRLYQMDMGGQLEQHVIPTIQDISRPMFHPNGKSIAMTLGKVDRDIAQLSLEENTNQESADSYTFSETPVARSIMRESSAQFSPNGKNIAFFSDRSGTRQLWLQTESALRQLSKVKQGGYLDFFVWSPNGKQLAVSTENNLLLIDTQGKTETIPLNFRATRLFQWTKDNQLLLSIVDNDGIKLVLFDMTTQTYQTYLEQWVRWAQQDNQGNILFSAKENRISIIQGNKPAQISELADISNRTRFFVRQDNLYILNEDDSLWRFNLLDKTRKKIIHHRDSTISLTDVSFDQQKLLISKHVSVLKEIVLLEESH